MKAQRVEPIPVSVYDKVALKAEMVRLARPQGASALARSVGVSSASANRWSSPGHSDVPAPERWPAIEKHYGIKPGHLARVVGLKSQPPKETAVAALERRVIALEAEVKTLHLKIADFDFAADIVAAARRGGRQIFENPPEGELP